MTEIQLTQQTTGFIVAAARSGSGKTTITAGIMAALRRRGMVIGGAKVGPDYIDTSYHRIACGRPSYNLDAYLTGGSTGIQHSLRRAGKGADLVVVEGVMGLFDGAYEPPASLSAALQNTGDPRIPFASTAHVAAATSLPVVLIVDVQATSQTAAAIVHGLATYSEEINIAAVILNKVATQRQEESIVRALHSLNIQYLGALPTSAALHIDRRHLGLIPATEYHPTVDVRIHQIADEVSTYLNIDALVSLARPISHQEPRSPALPHDYEQRAPLISYATGSAFSFTYQENLDILQEAGARLESFDPLNDEGLPPQTDLCLIGGGFPETYLDLLGANEAMLSSIRAFGLQGGPIWAECGGHLLLGQSLASTRLAALLPTHGAMTSRLTMGYREAVTAQETLLFGKGERITAHEFHYSQTTPEGTSFSYQVGKERRQSGFAHQHLLSSYLHIHLAGQPNAVERLLSAL